MSKSLSCLGKAGKGGVWAGPPPAGLRRARGFGSREGAKARRGSSPSRREAHHIESRGECAGFAGNALLRHFLGTFAPLRLCVRSTFFSSVGGAITALSPGSASHYTEAVFRHAILAAVLLLPSCGFSGTESDRVLRQNEIEGFQVADTRLPASATNVRVFETRFQDTLMMLSFEASEADARRFATQILRMPPTRDGVASVDGGDMAPSWWQPRRTPQSEAGSWSSDRQQLNVKLLLVPAGGRATVWLIGGWD
ncbi:MAG TPA: hypothetical protein VEC11_16425 [Allosphingosinicella sp.]|nr:hypothetical protein [Allosphingosinicella sp.]